jgi:hypothetical protein
VKVYSLPTEDKLSVYELYIEHLKITQDLKECFELTKYLPEFLFKVPQFYNASPEFHSRFSSYMSNLKDNSEIGSPMTPVKSFSTSTQDCSHDSSPTTLNSLNEIAKITLVMIHPNRFFNPASHTPLFDAPNSDSKKVQPCASVSHLRTRKRTSISIEPLRSERKNYQVEEPVRRAQPVQPVVVQVTAKVVKPSLQVYCEQTFARTQKNCPTIIEESFCRTSEQGSVPKKMMNFKFFFAGPTPGSASAR